MLGARQWSTRRSGPLAPAVSAFLGAGGYFRGELVVHSDEWTTGSSSFCFFGGKWLLSGRASGPLDGVDHWLQLFLPFWGLEATFEARQWSTRPSGPLAPAFSAFLGARGRFRGALVVHSTEWTTSSGGIYLFRRPAPCSLFPKHKRSPATRMAGLFAVNGIVCGVRCRRSRCRIRLGGR